MKKQFKLLGLGFFLMIAMGCQGVPVSAEPAPQGAKEATPPPSDEAAAPTKDEGKVASGKDRMIAVGDRVRVKIYPEDEFIKSSETEVSSEGAISLPMIGQVKVLGLKVVDAEREIVKLLAEDYLVNPVVVIEVVEAEAGKGKRSVSILGQVQKPGSYDFVGGQKLTLLRVISMAGGFTDIANASKIKVIRKEKGKSRVIRANAEAIISGKNPDIELEPGDVIHVGESFF